MKIKTQILAILILFLVPAFIYAQEKVEVVHKTVAISPGEQPAYVVEIPESDYKDVTDDWKKIIRQNTKSKVEEVESEYIIKGTVINEISQNPINIYSTVIHSDSTVKIIAAFEIDSVFFFLDEENKTVQNEKTHQHIQHLMHDFAINQYINYVADDLSDAQKELKSKNKEYKNILGDIESQQKDIKQNEQDIKDSEDLISSYETDNERKLGEINAKKEANALVSGEDAIKQARSDLKSLEKEKKGIENDLAKEKKNIVKYQSNIKEAEHKIENLTEQQQEKKEEIEKQEDIVKAIDAKLAGIK
jgi:predicted  nucleic acid-binding Zn-ribbon protein